MDPKSRAIVRRLEERYNGDHDLVAGGPDVTWADRELLELVKVLFDRVEDLKAQVERLERLRDIDRRGGDA